MRLTGALSAYEKTLQPRLDMRAGTRPKPCLRSSGGSPFAHYTKNTRCGLTLKYPQDDYRFCVQSPEIV
jgi:hypothetical protein